MVSDAEKLNFEILCQKVAAGELSGVGIGTFSEKRLHKILKSYICSDESCHEIRIDKSGKAQEKKAVESGRGGYIADIFVDGHITEIQTAGFYPLKNKIEFYLSNTDYDITVVHPIAAVKWVIWIDPESGEMTKKNRSPKKGRAEDIAAELFWLLPYLKDPRLNFKILLLEMEEYRLLNGWSRDKKRGSRRYERVPCGLCDVVDMNMKNFEEILVPQGLDGEFTASHFSKIMKIKGRKLSCVIKVFCEMGFMERIGKKGNSYIYKLTPHLR